MTDRASVLSVAELSVHVRDRALVHEVNLHIGAGQRVGLIGESGSGKSLTALAIMGLMPDALTVSGSVRLTGSAQNLVGAPERVLTSLRGNTMSMVFQEPMTALNPTMTIRRQVAEVLLLHRREASRSATRGAVQRLLDEVGLRDPERIAGSYPHQLSGGQRQRVMLAIALANDPALLICDEPTTALDVTVQAKVLDLIATEVASRDAALLFISHDLAVVATICEQVAVMRQGRIVETGTAKDILTRPQHPYTQRLVAASDLSGTAQEASGGIEQPGIEQPGIEQPVIEARDVVRIYPRPGGLFAGRRPAVPAVDEVSFSVAGGERLGIVGESGSGKSTLLRLIAGLDHPTSGQIRVDGQVVSHRRDRDLRWLRHRMQMVFQDPRGSLDPRMRILDIVAEPLHALGVPGARARVEEVLAAVGLDPQTADRFPHQFSGGQRQRISIARALAPHPQILLADEPVSALDVSVRGQVLDLLADLVADLGLTLVMVSHDLAVVRHVCTRVLVMRSGRIVEHGAVDQVYTQPRQAYTAALVAALPTIRRALAGATTADLNTPRYRHD